MPQPTMKVRADRAALAEALGWVARAIHKNPQVPVLAGVRVTAEPGVVKVSAFDYETSHVAAIEATVGDEGECIVPGLFFRDAIAGGRGAEVDLILDGQLEVTSGRSTFRARTLPVQDAPDLPPFPDVHGVVSADSLRSALALLAPAISDDPTFRETQGVHIEGSKDRLEFVATDRFRFHTVSLPWSGDQEFEVTVPGKSLLDAVKGMTENVEVGVSENTLGLSDGRHQWTTRRFATPYVQWRRVVETYSQKCQERLPVERDDLLAAVKAVGAMAEDPLPTLLMFADGELTVRTPEQDQGDASEVLSVEGDVPVTLAVNHRYLADALGVTRGPVALRYGGSYAKSGAFLVADESQPDLTLIVMSKSLPGGTR